MSPSSTCYTARFAPNCAAADGFSSRSIDAARLRLPSIGGVDAASAAGGDTGDVVKGGKPAGIPPGNGPVGVDDIVTPTTPYIVRLYEDKQKGRRIKNPKKE